MRLQHQPSGFMCSEDELPSCNQSRKKLSLVDFKLCSRFELDSKLCQLEHKIATRGFRPTNSGLESNQTCVSLVLLWVHDVSRWVISYCVAYGFNRHGCSKSFTWVIFVCVNVLEYFRELRRLAWIVWKPHVDVLRNFPTEHFSSREFLKYRPIFP